MTHRKQARGKPGAPGARAPRSAGGPETTDRSRISLEQPHEVRYWTRELGISEDELRGAIAALGSNSATRVREFLRTSGIG